MLPNRRQTLLAGFAALAAPALAQAPWPERTLRFITPLTPWHGLLGPAGITPAIADRIATEAAAILRTEQAIERIRGFAAVPSGIPTAEFGRFMAQELESFRALAARTGINAG